VGQCFGAYARNEMECFILFSVAPRFDSSR
jgi:hypothetical protein